MVLPGNSSVILVPAYNLQQGKDRSSGKGEHWEGPYTVIKKKNDVVYLIQK